MTKFKIVDTQTGLYSCGGFNPEWDTRGKTWDSKKGVTSHLQRHYKKRAIPSTWQIAEFKVTLTEINRFPVEVLEVKAKPCKLKKQKPKERNPRGKKSKSKSPKKTGRQSGE